MALLGVLPPALPPGGRTGQPSGVLYFPLTHFSRISDILYQVLERASTLFSGFSFADDKGHYAYHIIRMLTLYALCVHIMCY